jgi:peptidoglycan L-alanyl-D-glutamate endopeptidase CwlK
MSDHCAGCGPDDGRRRFIVAATGLAFAAALPMRLLHALERRSLVFEEMIRMAIATVYVETGGFAPISEMESKFNTAPGAHPFNLYDDRRDLGNLGAPDGETFKGRGFVQLTGRANYEKHGKRLGIELVADPERANDPDVAARVLAEYLKAREAEIRAALAAGDLARARKLVNGGSHGLERFARSFQDWNVDRKVA